MGRGSVGHQHLSCPSFPIDSQWKDGNGGAKSCVLRGLNRKPERENPPQAGFFHAPLVMVAVSLGWLSPRRCPVVSQHKPSSLSMGGTGAGGQQIAGYRQGVKKTGVPIAGVLLVIPSALLRLMAVCSLQGCEGPAGPGTGEGSWETGEQLGKLPFFDGNISKYAFIKISRNENTDYQYYVLPFPIIITSVKYQLLWQHAHILPKS